MKKMLTQIKRPLIISAIYANNIAKKTRSLKISRGIKMSLLSKLNEKTDS